MSPRRAPKPRGAYHCLVRLDCGSEDAAKQMVERWAHGSRFVRKTMRLKRPITMTKGDRANWLVEVEFVYTCKNKGDIEYNVKRWTDVAKAHGGRHYRVVPELTKTWPWVPRPLCELCEEQAPMADDDLCVTCATRIRTTWQEAS